MQKYDLSILIPARNEMFLAKTIENILENIEGRTEVIAVLDGAWADPPIAQDPRVTIVYFPESVGQREATNQACRISKAKYVMKVDAHCSFDKGFDVKMMADMHDDWTLIPTMRNLHAFDWKCKKCGNKWYQGQTPTQCYKDYKAQEKNEACDSTEFEMDITWIGKNSPQSRFYRFDKTLHFQYWNEFKKRPEANGDLLETLPTLLTTDDSELNEEQKQVKEFYAGLNFSDAEIKTIADGEGAIVPTKSIQGSCFMLTRRKYWQLDICDKNHGSWGQQGVEVSCKTWLSGGKVMNSDKTWYAHMFRTQGGDFGFPYPNPGISKAREFSRDLWMNNKWDKAKLPLQWLLDRFDPVPDWDVNKGILYYSDNELDPAIMKACQDQIKLGAKGNRIVSVTLKPTNFGDNIHLPLQRGYLTMAKQILAGLKELDADIIFFTEHDVLYHPSHFDFVPSDKKKIYYNTNVWKVRYEDGHAVKTDNCQQLSGLCAYRDVLIKHYEQRVKLLEQKLAEGVDEKEFNKYVRKMGFEPGTHNREERVDDLKTESWEAQEPNVDIRHDSNLTPSRWSKDQFRNQKYTKGWKESESIPGWGKFQEFFTKITPISP